uniref:Uncharacterized protein n=1 Tax=Glossina palpalis gambiensis TaxID=67801 RepID=A0A1B0B4E9_9MUSC
MLSALGKGINLHSVLPTEVAADASEDEEGDEKVSLRASELSESRCDLGLLGCLRFKAVVSRLTTRGLLFKAKSLTHTERTGISSNSSGLRKLVEIGPSSERPRCMVGLCFWANNGGLAVSKVCITRVFEWFGVGGGVDGKDMLIGISDIGLTGIRVTPGGGGGGVDGLKESRGLLDVRGVSLRSSSFLATFSTFPLAGEREDRFKFRQSGGEQFLKFGIKERISSVLLAHSKLVLDCLALSSFICLVGEFLPIIFSSSVSLGCNFFGDGERERINSTSTKSSLLKNCSIVNISCTGVSELAFTVGSRVLTNYHARSLHVEASCNFFGDGERERINSTSTKSSLLKNCSIVNISCTGVSELAFTVGSRVLTNYHARSLHVEASVCTGGGCGPRRVKERSEERTRCPRFKVPRDGAAATVAGLAASVTVATAAGADAVGTALRAAGLAVERVCSSVAFFRCNTGDAT